MRNTVEPEFDAEREVGGIDGEHEPAIENALVEPFGQHELHALAAARTRGELLPFVDPGELLATPVLAVTDGGADDGRLQARERTLEELVFAAAGGAPDGDQKLTRREPEEP